jgi:hypothetical protein
MKVSFTKSLWPVLLISTSNYAQVHTAPSAPKDKQTTFKEKEFKPHMVDHFNQGCPANSECSPEMGKLFKSWTDSLNNFGNEKSGHLLLERFRQANGVPFEVWTTSKATAKDRVIFWDSPCQEHNLENQEKIGIGMVMVKNLKELQELAKENKIYLRYLKLYQSDKKTIKTYQTLRGETPLYIENDQLIYQKVEEGQSYGLSVGLDGKLKIVTTQEPKDYPRLIDCPKELEEEANKILTPKNLYAGFYCQRTWNKSTDKFDTLMVGWSCN